MAEDPKVSQYRALLRDLKSLVERFNREHPELAGRGATLEFTFYDKSGESGTASVEVGERESAINRFGTALGRLQQTLRELRQLRAETVELGPIPMDAIDALEAQASRIVKIYEGR